MDIQLSRLYCLTSKGKGTRNVKNRAIWNTAAEDHLADIYFQYILGRKDHPADTQIKASDYKDDIFYPKNICWHFTCSPDVTGKFVLSFTKWKQVLVRNLMTAGNLIATEETFVPESRSLMNTPILTAIALCTSTNPTWIAAPLSQSQLWYSPIVSFLLCYQIKACPMYWNQTALNISVNKILAPYSCLDRTINLPCSTIALNISKTKVLEILTGKTGTKQKPARFSKNNYKNICVHFSVLFCMCHSFAYSLLFNDICLLFFFNQFLHHL